MAKHQDINTRAQLHYLKFSGARVYNNTTQSVSNSTATALTLNTEEYDTDSIHSTVTNTSRMTIPAGLGGYWYFKGSATIAAGGSAGLRAIWLRKNGADTIGTSISNGSSNVEEKFCTSGIFNLVATDYIELFGFQTSGGALNYGSANDEAYTLLECYFVGPAT